jgi:regulator of replication initiation timing
MTSVQLQFDLGPINVQHQIAELEMSMGKVRRKLFAEMQEVKNQYAELLKEHEALKLQLQALSPLSQS